MEGCQKPALQQTTNNDTDNDKPHKKKKTSSNRQADAPKSRNQMSRWSKQ